MPLLVTSLANAHDALRAPGIVLPSVTIDARADEIAIISHELRNSLGVVRNAARLLRMSVGPGGVDSARVLIERHVGQMNRHIEDLLDAAHQDARSKVLHLTHFDLRTIVEFAVNDIAADLAQRGHRLVMTLPAEAIWVHADVSRLEQVFSNLLINAAKYTPDGGEIVLTMRRLDLCVSISIRDSGIGIAPTVLPRVFDMFSQADAAAPCAEGGSGIGLGVVRELVELHGGSVQAASAGLGLGSEFTVLLPGPWAQADPLSATTTAR
ncbi:MAG TPA: HAMP domain-containing sensor histidine kinase [Steroidobacteraceae bacterium]|jgi:signal transduction histidine kinase|nr:HAMP domain-containing sensor histidine kinase [Steroidobacteraceae bacterium]